MANIDDILKKDNKKSDAPKDIIYFDGTIDEDGNDEYFRLYPDPRNNNKYLRIKKTDIAGDIYEYPEEKLKDAGIIPPLGLTPNNKFSMFQVPVKHGVEIECISLEKAKVGIEYPKSFVKLFVNNHKKECTCDERKPKTREGATCYSSGVCTEGCQWCPSLDGTSCHCSSCCN